MRRRIFAKRQPRSEAWVLNALLAMLFTCGVTFGAVAAALVSLLLSWPM